MIVIKRDGREEQFELSKIVRAVTKAYNEIYGDFEENTPTGREVKSVAAHVSEELSQCGKVNVEDVQDAVENALMELGVYDVAKAYIQYRYLHELQRLTHNDIEMLELINGDNEYWNTENSNKNSVWVTTQRDYLAGIVSKDLAKTYLFPKKAIDAHEQGIIHIHDLDYAIQPISNCSLVNLEDMLQNGTVINGVKIDRPHRIITAATIASQVIAAVSSSQFGGVTFTLTHLAPFVRSSHDIYYDKYIAWGFGKEEAERYAQEDTNKEVSDAVQTLVYQLNSLTTTNG